MSVHNSLPTQMLLKWGSDAQKERFLEPMARGEMLGAFALSEPDAGSDAASLRTQAVRDGDDWVLNGTKAWVSSGSEADVDPRHGAHRCRRATAAARAGSAPSSSPPTCRASRWARRRTRWGCAPRPPCSSCFDDLRVPARESARRRRARVHLRHAVARQRAAGHRRPGHRHRARGARARGGVRRRAASSSASRSRSSRPSSSSSPTWRRGSPRRARCSTPRRRPRIAAST